MNIHELLEYGEIVGNDETLDVLIVYDGESEQALLFQGNTEGDYQLTDTLNDVGDDEESIDAAIESLLATPE